MSEFPYLNQNKAVYLDSAATTHKPFCVIEKQKELYTHHYATVNRGVYSAAVASTTLYERARETVAQFLGVQRDEIVFTKGTTESLNLLAHTLPSQKIALSEVEHHANIVPWQLAGFELVPIPVNDQGVLDLNTLEKALQDGVKLVSVAHISNVLGTIHPIEKIAKLAHKYGAILIVDGAQSVPSIPLDLKKLDVDFYAFSGHKCYGPTGIGVLYGKSDLLQKLSPYQGGGDMIETVTFEKTSFQRPPARFEAGTPPFVEAITLATALDFLKEKGMDQVYKHGQALLKHGAEQLQKIPLLRIHGTAPQKGPIISFSIEGIHPLDLGTLLDLKRFAVRTGHLCAQTCMKRFGVDAMTRISFGLYNTKEEVDNFVLALKDCMLKLS